MSLQVLEELAREAEDYVCDRYRIGYARGLKAAVLAVRLGESLDRHIADVGKLAVAFGLGGPRDLYDFGFLDGLKKAKRLVPEEKP